MPALPAPCEQGQRTPTAWPRDGQPGEDERPIPNASHHGERSPLPGKHSPTARHAMSSRACQPRDRCPIPTPAHPHPEHVGSGPRQHAPRTRSRGRVSAQPQALLTKAGCTPPWMLFCRCHSAQHQLARVWAVGSVPGSHSRTSRARRTRAADPDYLPKGRPPSGRSAHNPRRPSPG